MNSFKKTRPDQEAREDMLLLLRTNDEAQTKQAAKCNLRYFTDSIMRGRRESNISLTPRSPFFHSPPNCRNFPEKWVSSNKNIREEKSLVKNLLKFSAPPPTQEHNTNSTRER